MTKFLLLFLLGSQFAMAEGLRAVIENREGLKQLKENQPLSAQNNFSHALKSDPDSAAIHLNMGLSFYSLKQMEKAQASFETALQFAKEPVTKFAALFNLGTLMQSAQKKDEALAYYQKALTENPDSHETKVNIEMLMQDGQGKGQGESKDDQKDKDQKKDNPDGKGDQDKKEQDKDDKDKKDPEKKQGPYSKNKPQPKPFKSEELTQGDVNKILGEIKQQEGKIRADYYKKEVKEKPRDKDW